MKMLKFIRYMILKFKWIKTTKRRKKKKKTAKKQSLVLEIGLEMLTFICLYQEKKITVGSIAKIDKILNLPKKTKHFSSSCLPWSTILRVYLLRLLYI